MNNLAEQGNMPAILALEAAMRAMPQIESEPKHYRMNGVYVRELFIPAGTLLTGKIHNHESIGILAQGRLRITNGTDSVIVEAPYVTVDKPGVKRLGYAETDCTFLCVHRTDSETLEEMEEELVSETFEDYERKTQHMLNERSI